MEIRTVIADDESLARNKLRLLLGNEPDVRVLAECSDGREALEASRQYRPDLLMLDIEMPGLDGLGVLRELAPAEIPAVVFTTAYDEYADDLREHEGCGYLTKPFDQERLHHAIERVRDRVVTSQAASQTSPSQNTLGASSMAEGRIIIKSGGRVIFLNTEEIDWIGAEANYVRFHIGKESYLLREKISRLVEKLAPQHFVRIHRSTIVNVKRIKELQPCNSGEFIVKLENGTELSLSRSYRNALQPLIERRL